MFIEYFEDGVLPLLGIVGQCDEFFRATVDLAPLKIHDAAAQRMVGGVLVGAAQGGAHVKAPCVGFFAILGKHQLAHHFGDVLGMDLLA